MLGFLVIFRGADHEVLFAADKDGAPLFFRAHDAGWIWFQENLGAFDHALGPNLQRELRLRWPMTEHPVKEPDDLQRIFQSGVSACRLKHYMQVPAHLLSQAPGIH